MAATAAGKRLLPTHDERVLRLMLTFRPKGLRQARIHAIVVALLDTGCRIQELLSARTADFDFHQLLLTVVRKGRKDRRVPFPSELRPDVGAQLMISQAASSQ